MHLVDTLDLGGAERVAVNLVNALPRELYRASLCTTRRDGPLAELVAPDVGRLSLNRRGRFDRQAIGRLVRYIKAQQVQLLHAHGTALFIARVAAAFPPYPAVIWHDHFGRYAVEERSPWLYRLATRRIAGVIAVNEALVEWSRVRLRVPRERVWYLRNFVPPASADVAGAASGTADLPGDADSRIVCVANFRPQKDHLTLLDAMAGVASAHPTAHLLLVGEAADRNQLRLIEQRIQAHALGGRVTILGPRRDVPAILAASAIGVLSSESEGLPLALIEYGMAGLAVVAPAVGQCAEVLDGGHAGILVQPKAPGELTAALLALLQSPERRRVVGARLHRHVAATYGQQQAVCRVREIYDRVLAKD
jgi:glycosyltransferase involved in cell wall biosynthesis